MLAVNLHLTYLMILDLNLEIRYPHLLWVPYSYLTAIGPLIYLYTQSLLVKSFQITRKELTLFIPVALEVILQVIQITYSSFEGILYYNTPSDFTFTIVIYVASAISIFYYSMRSLQMIHSHEKWAKRNFSDLKDVTVSWLDKLLSYYRILWLLWIPFAIVFLVFFRLQIQTFALILIIYLLIIGITYLTYLIGIEGLRRIDLVFPFSDTEPSETKAYDTIPLEKINLHVEDLLQLMTKEQLYLNETLSLRDLSDRLDVDPNLLSYLLNSHLDKPFHEFINSYRVDEVKKKLEESRYKNRTLLGIALESGFNSKTSINRVFKQITGMTPTQYQKSTKN